MKASMNTNRSNYVHTFSADGAARTVSPRNIEKFMDSAVQIGRDMFELASNAENVLREFLGLPTYKTPEKAAPDETEKVMKADSQAIDKNAYMETVIELTKLVIELVRDNVRKPGYQPEKVQQAPRRGYQPRKIRQAPPRRRFQPEKVQAKDQDRPERVREDRSWMSSLVTRIVMELAELLLVLLAALEKADKGDDDYIELPKDRIPGEDRPLPYPVMHSNLPHIFADEFTKAL